MSDHANELTHRAIAMLRAVAAGRGQISLSCEPDLFVDGLACCDQQAAHLIGHAELIRPARPGRIGERVAARLTAAGHAAIHFGDPLDLEAA